MLRRALLALVVPVLVVAGACSDDGDDATTATQETATTADGGSAAADQRPLRILVSNDDGIAGPGLDLMVDALLEMPDVEVTVVAPAEDQSGTSDRMTDGGAEFSDGATAGGLEGTAVDGFPADTVTVGLDELGLEPDVIVSGINEGQNYGPFAELSGTVGVVREGVRRGVPGVAVSAGPDFDEAQYRVGADLVVEWLEENREALVSGEFPVDVAYSFNIPTCAPDRMGDLVETERATELPPDLEDPFGSSCDLSDPRPANDVAAVRVGFPSLTTVDPEL